MLLDRQEAREIVDVSSTSSGRRQRTSQPRDCDVCCCLLLTPVITVVQVRERLPPTCGPELEDPAEVSLLQVNHCLSSFLEEQDGNR